MLTFIAVLALSGFDHKQAKPPQKPQPAKSQLRQLLDAPIYYLNFKMHITASGAGSTQGELPSSYSVSLTRDVENMITLAGRSQGASLSMMDMIPKDPSKLSDPTKFDPTMMDPTKLAENYCTWMAGVVPPSEPQTDANGMKYMNEAVLNYRGTVKYSGEFHSKQPISESDELEDVVTNSNYEGKSQVSCPQPPMFEINGVQKTFKLLVAYDFSDPNEESAIGETVTTTSSSRGSHTAHTPIKQGLWMSRPVLEGSTEPTIKLEGKLPESGSAVSGSWSYPVVVDGIPGTMTITAVLTPTRAEQLELIVTPPKDYDAWRPMGNINGEDEEGNSATVNAHLQKVGGGVPTTVKVDKFEWKLVNTSDERGVCMNWPMVADATDPFDLQIKTDKNPDLIVKDEKGQSAADTSPAAFDTKVTVSSFDYGGSCELQVTAYMSNGAQIVGYVKGGSDVSLMLPKRPKKTSYVAASYIAQMGSGSMEDSDDTDSVPEGNSFLGDGLTLYEEYRGFMEDGRWMTGDPKRKELFLVNEMRGEPHTWKGISIYKRATNIQVHGKLLMGETNAAHVINFNHTKMPHAVDQHALYIVRGRLLSEGEDAAGVRNVGPPRIAVDVTMPPDWKKWQPGNNGSGFPWFACTIAHEMSHGSSVRHHGEIDYQTAWADLQNPPRHVEGPAAFNEARGRWEWSGPQTEIIIKRENGTIVPPNGTGFYPNMWISVQGGQHSGDNDCYMKYACGSAYKVDSEPNVRYLTSDEVTGVVLCTAPDGTGENDSGRSPRSRHGDATLGNCETQLCINDRFQPGNSPLNSWVVSLLPARLPLAAAKRQEPDLPVSSPSIIVGANDVSGQSIKPGWPIIVSVSLVDDEGVAHAPPAGLTPKLIDGRGKPVALQFEQSVQPTADQPVAYWVTKEGSTSSLAAGTYQITLAGTATQEIEPAQVTVKTGDALTDSDLGLLHIQLLMMAGKNDDAEKVADQLIAQNPGNIDALTAKGDIRMDKGDAKGALDAYSQALGYVPAGEEALSLRHKISEAAMKAMGVASP